MVLIAVMLDGFGAGVQALVALLMVQVAIVLHVRKEPFSYESQDRLETSSLGCSFLCLIGGLVFWSQDIADGDEVTDTTDFASLILTFTIVGLNVAVFVFVIQKVLVSQIRALLIWVKLKWKKHKADKLARKGSGKGFGLWFKVKSCIRGLKILYTCKRNKAKVYSADEDKQMKIANNARLKAERLETAEKLEQISRLEKKLKAAHRSLFRIAQMREDMSRLKDPDYGLPSLEEDIDGVSEWMSRLGDSIKLESFDKSRRVTDEPTTKMIEHVEWWARNELPNEVVAEVEAEPELGPPPVTLEDLEEIWNNQSMQCQTESEFNNDMELLAALEKEAKLHWVPAK